MYDRFGIQATNNLSDFGSASGNLNTTISSDLSPYLYQSSVNIPSWGTSYATSNGGYGTGGGYIFPNKSNSIDANGNTFPSSLINTWIEIPTRYIRFYFKSDGSSNYDGWDLDIAAGLASTGGTTSTLPATLGGPLYIDQNDYTKTTQNSGGPQIGYVAGTDVSNDAIYAYVKSTDYSADGSGSGGSGQSLSLSGNDLSISGGNTVTLSGGTDSQTLSISGNSLSITGGNSVTIPSSSGGGLYSFSNGLTESSGDVKLGGSLTGNTTINLNNNDLYFSGSSSGRSFVNFGASPSPLPISTLDGSVLSSYNPYLGISETSTIDVILGVYNGTNHGNAIKLGSIEHLMDGARHIHTSHSFSPMYDAADPDGYSIYLGTASHRWSEIYSANGTVNTSDINDKTNVKHLLYGLDEVMQLQPIIYQWKNQKLGNFNIPDSLIENKIGFSAQDLQLIIPEVVKSHTWETGSENENDFKYVRSERLGVYYSDLIPVLTKAIQEQQSIIEDIKKDNENLRKEIEEIKQLILNGK
jgi:hypothetical protein